MALTQPTITVQFAPSNNALDVVPTWVDITSYVQSISTKRGRQHELNKMDTGTASLVLDNKDGRFNPWNSTSPYYNGGTGLLPGKQLRITATWSGTTYNVWFGYIDSFPVDWPTVSDSTVEITASDAFKLLNLPNITDSGYLKAVKTAVPALQTMWRLGDPYGSATAADSSGNNHTGSVVGNVAFGQSGAFNSFDSDTAATFSGGAITGTTPATSGQLFGFSIWFRTSVATGTSTAGFGTPYSAWREAASLTYVRVQLIGDGAGGLRVSATGINNGSFPFSVTSTRANLNDGKWHHIAVAGDQTPNYTWSVYIDNVLDGSQTVAGGVSNCTVAAVGGLYSNGPTLTQLDSGIDYDEAYVAFSTFGATQVNSLYQLAANPWTGDTSTQRIARILDLVSWPSTLRVLAETGLSTIQPPTSSIIGTSSLGHMQAVEETENGVLFVDTQGRITFYNRRHVMSASSSVSNLVTIGDGGAGSGEEPFQLDGTRVVVDDLDLWNQVVVSSQGQPTQIASDSTSQTRYGRRTLAKSGLLNTTVADLSNLAYLLLSRYKDPVTRVESVTLRPNNDPSNLFPQVLVRDLLDRVVFLRRPLGGSDALRLEALIEGVEHKVTADDWTTVWHLSVTDAQKYWILGTSALGTDTRLA